MYKEASETKCHELNMFETNHIEIWQIDKVCIDLGISDEEYIQEIE